MIQGRSRFDIYLLPQPHQNAADIDHTNFARDRIQSINKQIKANVWNFSPKLHDVISHGSYTRFCPEPLYPIDSSSGTSVAIAPKYARPIKIMAPADLYLVPAKRIVIEIRPKSFANYNPHLINSSDPKTIITAQNQWRNILSIAERNYLLDLAQLLYTYDRDSMSISADIDSDLDLIRVKTSAHPDIAIMTIAEYECFINFI
jgi:hypothetical protein